MTLADLKLYFRQLIKPVPGGPPVGTPGSNRTAGVLAALDKLAEETTPDGLLAKIDVTTSAANGVQVSVTGGLLVFGLSGGGTQTPPTPSPSPTGIVIGGTIGTPGILMLSTVAY